MLNALLLAAARCGNLDSPRNGRVDLTGTTVGSTATYRCKNGFILANGNRTRECGANGQWSGTAPNCVCKLLTIIMTLSCKAYLRLLIANVPTNCIDFNVPCTAVVNCGNLANPTNGRVDLTGKTVGSTATYRCKRGFRLQGQSRRTCQNNGQWSGRAPTCQRELNITNPCASMHVSALIVKYD